MNFSTAIKQSLNGLLSPWQIKIETLRAEQQEIVRLRRLKQRKYFDEPAFPLPEQIRTSDWRRVVQALPKYRSQLERLQDVESNDVGYSENNAYYHPPDSDVLYTLMRELQPARVYEIGSGHSTRIVRQAILDGQLATRITSIDPHPRVDIVQFSDDIRPHRVEEIPAEALAGELQAGDVLFIDSSHMLAVGGDCVYEYLQLLPRLAAGVIIHIHDVFLPWDYPFAWIQQEPQISVWSEQYLLQAMLQAGARYEVLWPGHYVQRTAEKDFGAWFPRSHGRMATSFWMRSY